MDAVKDALAAAFDRALGVVDRSIANGMRTADGRPAARQLEQLRARLISERALALDRGSVDKVWVGSVVRAVTEWLPESDIALIAALGAIARAKPPGAQ
jgi:hypothetical protein